MLRHNNELKAAISVVTKENYVVTIKVVESEIYVATENISVATEKWNISGTSQGKFVTIRDSMLQQKVRQPTRSKKTLSQHGKSLSRHRV